MVLQHNCNGTEWSPIWSVIIPVINRIRGLHSVSPICLITIWFQTHLDNTKFCYQLIITITKFVIFQAFLKLKRRQLWEFSARSKNKNPFSYHLMVCTVLLHCPIIAVILLHQKFLQFHWLRAVVFRLNLKYLLEKITNLLWVVV